MSAIQKSVVAVEVQGQANLSRDMKKAEKSIDSFGAAGRRANNSMRMVRGGATQLGHQIQDVAVQLQGGTHWLTVFGQQGSQVASLFGGHGALLGGLIAVGAALASVMVPNLFETTKEFEDLEEAILATVEATKKITEAQREALLIFALQKKEKLSAEYNKVLTKQIQTKQSLDELRAESERYKSLIGTMGGAFRDYEAKIEDVEKQISETTEEYTLLTAAVEESFEAFKKQRRLINQLQNGENPFDDGKDAAKKAEKAAALRERADRNEIKRRIGLAKRKIALINKELDEFVAAQRRKEELANREAVLLHRNIDAEIRAIEARNQKIASLAAPVIQRAMDFGKTDQQLIQEQLDAEIALLNAYYSTKVGMEQQHLAAIQALRNEAAAATAASTALQLQAGLQAMNTFVDQFQGLVDQSSAAGKAMFLVSKAIAMATTFVNYEMAIAKAVGTDPIFGIALSSWLRASQVASMAAIAGQTVAGFEGGGITFSGVRSGGIDGRGGRMAVVHPNEKITDLEKGGGTQTPVNVTMNISAIDAKGIDKLLIERRSLITGIVNKAVNNRGRSSLT